MNRSLSSYVISIAVAVLAFSVSFSTSPLFAADADNDSDRPLRVMIITAGCCHDYPFQTNQLMKAAKERDMVVDWTIIHQGGTGTKAEIALYENPNWAKGYDVVIHNECFANTNDPSYIRNITKAHKDGVNAVVIHCAMHTYRSAKIDDWRQMLGVTSMHHEHQSEYPVKVVAKDHPIMKDFPADYKTPKDELYIVKHVWPHTKVLATSTSEKTGDAQPVFWTNNYGKSRVFGTTYGHSNATFSDDVFLDTVMKGTLWAAGRLKADTPETTAATAE